MCLTTFQNRVIVCIASLSETQPWALSKLLSFFAFFHSLFSLSMRSRSCSSAICWQTCLRNKRPAAAFCQKCIKALHRTWFHISPAIWAPWNWTFASVERVSVSSWAESKQPPARGSYCVARKNGYHRPRLPAASRDSLPTPQEQETEHSHLSTTLQIIINICTKSVKWIKNNQFERATLTEENGHISSWIPLIMLIPLKF